MSLQSTLHKSYNLRQAEKKKTNAFEKWSSPLHTKKKTSPNLKKILDLLMWKRFKSA